MGKGNFAAARNDFGLIAVGHNSGLLAVNRDGQLVAVLDFAVRARARYRHGAAGGIVSPERYGFV